ncbi:MAG: hypothetical protein PVF31_05095 [Desulfobacterales bacterium]|jgi:hypothetical protein
MKRPTWVTIVGVLGIIFSCLGILAAGQEMIMPKILEMQKEMLSDIGIAMMFGGIFGIIIDIVLIIVVATGNKEAFYRQGPPPIPQNV